jgi:hypothetical protein
VHDLHRLHREQHERAAERLGFRPRDAQAQELAALDGLGVELRERVVMEPRAARDGVDEVASLTA